MAYRAIPTSGFDLRLVPEKVAEPFTWSKPQMVFVNSMSDLFHRDVPDEYIEMVANVMAAANWHTYQVLTKRSDRLRDLLQSKLEFAAKLPHIWWGVSVENRKHGLPRIGRLREAKSSMSFLSIEPLLEDLGEFDLTGMDWVIVGGESGAGARPMQVEWVTNIQRQCSQAGVPFFFKQWGGVRKSIAGRKLNGHTYDAVPQFVRNDIPATARRKELAAEFLTAWPPSQPSPSRRTA